MMISRESSESDKLKKIEEKEILLKNIKKQVKLLMEEYVNKKYVQEYSSNVIALCALIESCLLLGLKRRALGLFKESSSIALLEKIAKENASAKLVCTIISNEKQHYCDSLSDKSHFSSNTNSSISEGSSGASFSSNWTPASFLGFTSLRFFSFTNQSIENEFSDLHQRNLKKHYWIRLALTEKVLDKIIDFLVINSGMYYEKDSIIGDPCDGYILASLLSGPCSLEYSKVRNPEYIIENPGTEELLQKQKIQNNCRNSGVEAGLFPKLKHALSTSSLFWSSGQNQVLNRPFSLTRHRLVSSVSEDKSYSPNKTLFSTPKKYIESLHQSSDSTLLYGKNNVLSHPKDELTKISGYLSLHIAANELLIKWTPNDLINGGVQDLSGVDNSLKLEWDCAMIIWVKEIVYIHCHRQVDKGDTLVLVSRDGAQIPPLDFPKGGHLISFLGCLENGLLPLSKLDPPLSFNLSKDVSEVESKIKVMTHDHPKSADLVNSTKNEKVFFWSSEEGSEPSVNCNAQFYDQRILNRKSESSLNQRKSSKTTLDESSTDLVFRIVRTSIFNSKDSNSNIREEILDDAIIKNIQCLMSESGNEKVPQWPHKYTIGALKKKFNKKSNGNVSSISRLCSSMKKEILSRSFYGWLEYCRHIKAIRSQLSELVLPPKVYMGNEIENICLLTNESWNLSFNDTMQIKDHVQIQHQIYYGGCDPTIRSKVWPYLLGVYSWDSSEFEKKLCLKKWQKVYELAVSDWMIIETVIEDQRNELLSCDDQNEEDCILEIQREINQIIEEENGFSKFRDKKKKPKSLFITRKILNIMKQNLNRIEKDVIRCDRQVEFFDQTDQGEANLDILQRIMCTWVWKNIETGYIQGMCDLLAPMIVIFKGNEELTYACFSKYMERMIGNFPVKENNKMDLTFSRMRSAVQILDSELYDHIQNYGDFTHFYFSYRWFLLDFKREFSYSDVFNVWETIWAAEKTSSSNFSLFIGLALLLSYRDIIVDNNMEFTDIIRFFNEMAEQHNAKKVLELARDLIKRLQVLLHS